MISNPDQGQLRLKASSDEPRFAGSTLVFFLHWLLNTTFWNKWHADFRLDALPVRLPSNQHRGKLKVQSNDPNSGKLPTGLSFL